ncbi:unnamed protein product [Cochlearia groenlandica]
MVRVGHHPIRRSHHRIVEVPPTRKSQDEYDCDVWTDWINRKTVLNDTPSGFSLGLYSTQFDGVVFAKHDETTHNDICEQISNPKWRDIGKAVQLISEDVLCFLNDAPPMHDNMRGVARDEARIDLKNAGDAIYVVRVYKTKVELWNALALVAITNHFGFVVEKSYRRG